MATVSARAIEHDEAGEPRPPLQESFDFLLRDARRLLTKHVELRLGRHGISNAAWFPLRVLYENDGLTQRELGRRLGLLDAATGTMIESLEQLKLVVRIRNAGDRRKINVSLTPAGRRMAKRVLGYMREVNGVIVAGMTAEQAATFNSLLRRAHSNLELMPH